MTIPIGCVLGGAFHDYMVGMISLRSGGEQTPGLIRRYPGKHLFVVYNVFVCLLMLLVGVVFIYTPGDLHLSWTVSCVGAGVLALAYAAALPALVKKQPRSLQRR